MTRTRRLWELMDLGRGILEVNELTLLIGGHILIETAQRTTGLNSILGLQPDDTIKQLPERLAAHQRYQLLAEHLSGLLIHPGVEKVLDQIRYIASTVLNDVPQTQVWSVAGEVFSELLGRMDVMRAGFMTTPDAVADLVTGPLNLTPGMQVLDPAAHAGQLLVAVGRKLVRQGIDPEDVTLHGREPFRIAAALGQLNLLLNQLPKATMVASDVLIDEPYPLGQYDIVLNIPPFNADRVLDLERDPRFYRARKGGRIKSEAAYLQAGLAALKPGGQAVFLMPSGVLFTSFYSQLRESVAQEGIITAAVNLPAGLLSGTGISLALLVFDLPGRGEAKSTTTQLVEADKVVERSRTLPTLTSETIAAVVEGIRGHEQDGIKVCNVTLSEQAGKDYIWLLSVYQQQDIRMESLPDTLALLPAAIQQAQEVEQQVAVAMKNLQEVLKSSRSQ